MYVFQNIIGIFFFDKEGRFLKELKESELSEDYPILPKELYPKATEFFRRPEYYSKFQQKNIKITKEDIKRSTTDDLHIINAIRVIEDLTKSINLLIKRLREWYEYHNPEFSRIANDHERFIMTIIEKDKEEIMKSFGITETMGSNISELDITHIRLFCKSIKELILEKDRLKEYIEEKMNTVCPNMFKITGAVMGAYLLEHAGSLKHLSEMPASTIQLLGAEKALFRHIKSGARCPKYGVLLNHPFVRDAKTKLKGKAARIIADKISIATKVDYFKGDFIADKLIEQLEKKKRLLK